MEKNTRFSIRKLGVGVASVAVASFFACGTASAHNLEALTSSKANPELPFAHVPVKIEFIQAESPWLPTNAPENTNDAIEYTDAERPFAGRELPTAPVKANFDNPEAPFAPAKAEVEFTPAERPFAGRELPTPLLDANYNDPKAPFAPADQDQDESKSIPWTELVPAKRIEDNLGLDQEKENPTDPEKESIPWTELTPAEPIEDNLEPDQEKENSKDPEPETENSLNFAQTEMLDSLRKFRLANNSTEITYNKNVQPGTDLRAEEIATKFDHIRPNGALWHSTFTKDELGSAYGENIVSISKNHIDGAITEPENMKKLVNIFFTKWLNSPSHRKNMLDPNFSAVTFSIFDDGTSYYGVQIFTAQKP